MSRFCKAYAPSTQLSQEIYVDLIPVGIECIPVIVRIVVFVTVMRSVHSVPLLLLQSHDRAGHLAEGNLLQNGSSSPHVLTPFIVIRIPHFVEPKEEGGCKSCRL